MSEKIIITDLNKCVSCLACTVACKSANEVPLGNFWLKVNRIGPNPAYEGAKCPDMEMYFLPTSCQHCEDAPCTKSCPTGASHYAEDGTVQIDKEKCIGCQFCAMACPYGVRYLNEDEGVVEKCTRCYQRTQAGEVPACVSSCGGRARWYGDPEKGWSDFRGTRGLDGEYLTLDDENYVKPFTDDQIHALPDVGNKPSDRFILRNWKWRQ